MRILITAGPTREALDPVRYLSNRSSGKMGYALAEAAVEAGHEVVLVSGPVSLPRPAGAEVIAVESARQMFEAVRDRLAECDAAIFAAAVADYRPVSVSEQKIKKTGERLVLELERTEDILGSARSVFGFRGVLAGFAAESEKLVEHAREKLERKGCDVIIANDITQPGIGFDSAENAVTLCLPGGRTKSLPRQPKTQLARALLAELTIHRLSMRSEAARRFIAGHQGRLTDDLVRGLRAAVYASNDYHAWSEGLVRMGRVHGAKGVTVEHYREFRVVFLATLAELDAQRWAAQPELAQAWAMFFDCLTGHLARGLVNAAAQQIAA